MKDSGCLGLFLAECRQDRRRIRLRGRRSSNSLGQFGDLRFDSVELFGGGFPFGACLTTEACGEHMQPGSHGSTYGGNPLAMAVGNVVWDIISDEDFLAEVRRVSGTMAQSLKSIADSHPDKVEGVTGRGLLTGLKMKADPKGLQGVCRDKNLLVGVAGNMVLRLAPPLVITDENVREATGIIDAALSEWEPA